MTNIKTMNGVNPTLATVSTPASSGGFGMPNGRPSLSVWEAARVLGGITSSDVRDRSIVKAHLGLDAQFNHAFAPGTHAWSPPRC